MSGRVIARPFDGPPGAFVRRPERRDYSVPPPAPTALDQLVAAGRSVFGVGKIQDIFDHRGLSDAMYRRRQRTGCRPHGPGPPRRCARRRLHEPGRLRFEVRASQRSRRVCGRDRGLRSTCARSACGLGRGSAAHHRRSRMRSDDAADGPLPGAHAVARGRVPGRPVRPRHTLDLRRPGRDRRAIAWRRASGTRG